MLLDTDLLALFETLALDAGREIMRHYEEGFAIQHKADASPVTVADREAERIILTGLGEKLPHVPSVAEENAARGIIPECGDTFLLIDPLDGTKEFITRRPDFTVNIALVRHGNPVLGVVFAPARNLMFSGGPEGAFEIGLRDGEMAGRTPIRARPKPPSKPVILASKSHRTQETDAYIAKFPGSQVVSIGSSLKFCLLARGEADIYPRFGPTMQWDTAAGDAILRAAGGMTRDLEGNPLTYGKRDETGFYNPFFIAEGAS